MGRKRARYSSSPPIHQLFLLNVCLQLFDGLATYHGLQLGWQEGNPLLHSFMMRWGVEWTLLVFKGKACLLLLLLHRVKREELAIVALAVAAGCYFFFSFLPWLSCLVFLTPPAS
ncbi:MAG: DUF5658 family protein [Candidatus Binatia bacterium]|nr:DUF5658 family protein [Candidatus Binatia bacterium]